MSHLLLVEFLTRCMSPINVILIARLLVVELLVFIRNTERKGSGADHLPRGARLNCEL